MTVKPANLGPKSVAMMHRAGITTEDELRALGAARAAAEFISAALTSATLSYLCARCLVPA